jgi:hypothetical protein
MRMPKKMIVLPMAIALILGGAIGNLIDRVSLGYVVDFIHVYYQNNHFPAFNLADSAITLGTILLLIDTFFLEKKRNQTWKIKMTEIIQPNEEIRIQDGSKVDLHFSVSIENGVEIDNTRNREEPVSLVIGDGNLLPGFEKALFGLRAGDRRTVHLPLKMRLVLGILKISKSSIL